MRHRVSQLAICPPTKCLEPWHFAPCGKYEVDVLIERGQCMYKQRFGIFNVPRFEAALRITDRTGDVWVFAVEDVGHESDVFIVALHGPEHWLLANFARESDMSLIDWFHEHIGPLVDAKFTMYDEDQLQQSVREAYCKREQLVGTQAPPPPIRFLEIPFEQVPDFRGKPTDFAVGIAFGERCVYAAIFDKK